MEIGELTIVATDDVPAEALNSFASELSGVVRVNEVPRIVQLSVLPPSWVKFVFDHPGWLPIIWWASRRLTVGADAFVKGFGEQLGKNLADKLFELPKQPEGYNEGQVEHAVERVIDALVHLKERVPERMELAAALSLPNGEHITLRLEATDRSAAALSLAKFAALVPAIQTKVQSELESGREIEEPVLVLGSDGSATMKWIDPGTGEDREARL